MKGVSKIEVPPNFGLTIKANAVSQMDAAMAAILSTELSKLRTGRASPSILMRVTIVYRSSAMDTIKKLYSSLPKDDIKRLEKEVTNVDDLTKKFIKSAEDTCKAKEKEICQG